MKPNSVTADLTVHCLIRNEERFIRPAILAILPLARRVLVYDTGSADATLERVSSVQSDKLEVHRKAFSQPRELTQLRNEMIERTTTEWFMLVDGDEIYPAQAVRRIIEEMRSVPPGMHQIEIHRRHFIRSFNLLSGLDTVGRIYRTREVRWKTAHLRPYRLRADKAYLVEDPSAPLGFCTLRFPEDIVFFHCQYLVRSSRDPEMGALRRWRWRKPPLSVLPYFGPWPETLPVDGVATRMTPRLLGAWIGLQAQIIGTWGLTLARKALGTERAVWSPSS